jgi:hypothetical protein
MKGQLCMEKNPLTVGGSAAQEHVGIDRCRSEEDVRKDELARNEAGDPANEHEADDNVAFDV